jgi:hypothetical protein
MGSTMIAYGPYFKGTLAYVGPRRAHAVQPFRVERKVAPIAAAPIPKYVGII